MSWAEEQDWFGLEDLALEAREKARKAKELIKRGYWLQSNQEPIAIAAMSDRHLWNCIKMINDGRLNRPWALIFLVAEQARRINL